MKDKLTILNLYINGYSSIWYFYISSMPCLQMKLEGLDSIRNYFAGRNCAYFKTMAFITVIARKYSDSTKDNFDIFLPNWLAKYNKLIYTSFLFLFL
jgi:hypothetical protein